ncbi:MAG: hypothetical protein FWH12_05540 [Treponema sp.]|nr:hypothetical protein [Treponema sp.]
MSTGALIMQKAQELEFLASAIIPYPSFAEYTQGLDARVESFPHSRGHYEALYNQGKPIEGARSLIVCTQGYHSYQVPPGLQGRIGKMYLFDNRLSYAPQYRLRQEFETYLKTLGLKLLPGGVPSRWAAVKAGLAKFGRNNFVYDSRAGSYIIVHTWVTDAELDYQGNKEEPHHPLCREDCRKCIEACPTRALSGDFSMDRGACIAQLSFFGKEDMDPDLRREMGQWLYGCDVCQDVCPINKDALQQKETFPLLKEFEAHLELKAILDMDEESYQQILNPRFSYIGKDNLWLWKWNALRAMINSGEQSYHSVISKYCEDPDERLKNLALWGKAVLELK